MKNFLIKEFKLAAHPTSYIFLVLPLMLLIPNYPYTVTYFYFTLAVFFTCMTGREYKDIEYSMMLPISKGDIVKGRMAFVVLFEIASLILSIPFIIIRQTVYTAPNLGGMDANISLLAFGLILYSLFNAVFFIKYYKNVKKPGIAFIIAGMVQLVYVLVGEVVDHVLPVFTNVLDTRDTLYVAQKLILLLVCILIFAAVTFITYKISAKNFENQDI